MGNRIVATQCHHAPERARATRAAVARMALCAGALVSGASGAAPPVACASPRADTAGIPISLAPARDARTFYVRADGGDAVQCTGRADAAYPGSGSGKACAWKSPEIALPPSGPARISGGDTLLIGAGTYRIGDNGYLQPIPGGRSAATPTRVIGKPGTMPKIVGVGGIHRVLNLEGSSNVEVGRLEITDNSDCVFRHANPRVACNDAMAWARVGLYAKSSSNVWLHDLDIHGLAARGINAGLLSNWTLDRVRINRNGTAGWDGNVGDRGSDSGRMILRDVEIAWNGCGERVATGEPWACWAQSAGGYGDGFGTTETGGTWLIEDANVHHNTSDGLDLRYMDGADGTSVTVRRLRAVANAGNQLKIKGNALVEDSVLVGHCSFFRNRFFMGDEDLCRADGSTLQLVLTGGDTVTVRRNTIAGEGAVQIGHSEGDDSDRILVRDNLVMGFPYYRRPSRQSAFDGGKSRARIQSTGNIAWRVDECPDGARCEAPPKLANTTLAAFDARPLPGNPGGGKAGAMPCSAAAGR
ncbi:hypothetical protein ACFPN1_02465 [Lysobacter yangpyeongensis]|uniref:Right handed beta helix domain-containing protein n=1 Tax=Lysobacter yangpyeongensis TaxID=346182 RepID=A0ABW0SJ87_9GAMM